MKQKFIYIILLIFVNNLFALDIIYEPREPYIIEEKGTIKGLVASPLIEALERAKIDYTLKNRPSKRHLLEIKANKKEVCAIGWFKNAKREAFAKFTKPLYNDKPMGILVRSDSSLKDNITLKEIFDNDKLSILIKDSYSYGTFIDNKLKKSKLKVRRVSSDNVKMILLIAKKRADFMFISFEEARELLKTHPYGDIVHFLRVSDMPNGNSRYLICSKSVSDKTIQSINKNLR